MLTKDRLMGDRYKQTIYGQNISCYEDVFTIDGSFTSIAQEILWSVNQPLD